MKTEESAAITAGQVERDEEIWWLEIDEERLHILV